MQMYGGGDDMGGTYASAWDLFGRESVQEDLHGGELYINTSNV